MEDFEEMKSKLSTFEGESPQNNTTIDFDGYSIPSEIKDIVIVIGDNICFFP